MSLQSIPLETVLPFVVFLTITLGAWGLLSIWASMNSTAEARLQRIMNPHAHRADADSVAKKQDQLQTKFAAAANKLGKSLRPTNEADIGKVRLKLLNGGFRGEQSVQVFYGFKGLSTLLFLAIAAPLLVKNYGMTQTAMTYLALVAALGYYIPGVFLGSIIKKRKESIFLALPDGIDLMVVCVEAGLGLDAAMRRVTTELGESSPALCEEFAISNFQVQMGRPRRDVLRDLAVRTGVDDLRALAAVIIQAERFGSSVGKALRVHSDAMRLKRRQLAEERAAKTAVKIMIPLIMFIFPGVFIVLVGPAGIQIANTLMK